MLLRNAIDGRKIVLKFLNNCPKTNPIAPRQLPGQHFSKRCKLSRRKPEQYI
jgi:hypothetical protein